MITDRIGRQEVLLLINHNFNKICDIIGYFLHQNTRNSTFCFASIEKKKSHLSARLMARTVQLLGTLRSDNGDVHENFAEKQTSHHFKLFRDNLNSSCYSKEGDFGWS